MLDIIESADLKIIQPIFDKLGIIREYKKSNQFFEQIHQAFSFCQQFRLFSVHLIVVSLSHANNIHSFQFMIHFTCPK